MKPMNPSKIPPEDRVQLLRKGPDVQTGEFGNEGSGGQSYLIYPWQAATTYKFLLKANPVDNKQHRLQCLVLCTRTGTVAPESPVPPA